VQRRALTYSAEGNCGSDTGISNYVGADTILAHDATVDDFAQIGARRFIAGRARIVQSATVHPMSSIAIGESEIATRGLFLLY
jgi:carbonic anhydrase/acetyltransferase-like protein (isoleucine patch superfamily)